MKKKNAPTEEQKELFRLCVKEYATLLNLRDWRIEVSDKPACKGAMADCDISAEDHLAIIRIGADWGNVPVTDQIIRETAIHELLHVFVRPMLDAAVSRDSSVIASTEHSLITVLEKLLAA